MCSSIVGKNAGVSPSSFLFSDICKNKLITIVIEFENEFKSFINYIDIDNRLVQNTYYNKRFEKYFYVNSDKILIDFEILVFNPNGINSKFELKIFDDNKTISVKEALADSQETAERTMKRARYYK